MKRTIIILICVATLAILAISCYTTHKCPAYSYAPAEEKTELTINN